MSYMSTAKALATKIPFAGHDWYYCFRELPTTFDATNCQAVADRLLQRFSQLTKKWDKERNTEWTCRLFLASKFIMSATLHINSARYAYDQNLRVVVPYLRYYAALSLVRSLVYTLPEVPWSDGSLIQIAHGKAINMAFEHLRKFNQSKAERVKDDILVLKAERELISYRSPSVGDRQVAGLPDYHAMCTLLAELAQFNSELFERALMTHSDTSQFELDVRQLERLATVQIDGHAFGDIEDAYRLDYLLRKHPHPANLLHLMTEGHVEDYFGAWLSCDDRTDVFSPDEDQQIIFEIP